MKTKAIDKSVRGSSTTAKIVAGQIIVENKTCGILFSFPAAAWPSMATYQRAWVERLTPWWDMDRPQWSPTAHRLRESSVKAINKLIVIGEPAKIHLEIDGLSASEGVLASPMAILGTEIL